jgi:hypothetical protein
MTDFVDRIHDIEHQTRQRVKVAIDRIRPTVTASQIPWVSRKETKAAFIVRPGQLDSHPSSSHPGKAQKRDHPDQHGPPDPATFEDEDGSTSGAPFLGATPDELL